MTASDLLDWNHASGAFHGRLEEWAANYQQVHVPLKFVIVEVNAAQRYLLQYEHARRWSRQRQVSFVAHTTGVRKLDAKLGIYALRAPYRFGLVRLPGGDPVVCWPALLFVDQPSTTPPAGTIR